jgi:hypothetical protein
MTLRSAILVAAASFAQLIAFGACAAARGPCDDSLTESIPVRPANALGGHAFAQSLLKLSDDEREAAIRRELQSGNIPDFLRHFTPIRLPSTAASGVSASVVICVAPDYLAVGSDEDYLLMPMRLATALSTGSDFGLTLPTPRMVDAIYQQADVHVMPQPLPAGNEMRSTAYSIHHNELVAEQRAQLGGALGDLIAGDKKDLVLTNRLRDHLDRVAIYGWHTAPGRPIQPLSTVHGWRYADYSHGARWVSTRIFVDGRPRSLFDSLGDSHLAPVLSAEGVIADVVSLIDTLSDRVRSVVATVRYR